MDVTLLGTGSAMPTGERAQSGVLVERDGESLLVDCGSGVLSALARTDPGYAGLDAVLFTHHHLDHVADLMPLLKARWLAGEESLSVVGPAGTELLVEGLLDVHDYLRDRVDLEVREIEEGPVELLGFEVDTAPTVHSMAGFAYRFAHPSADADFCFSGDSEATTAIADLADGAGVLAHDCSFPDDVDVSNHPTPTKLADVLAGHDYGRVYLTHLYPHTEGRHGEMLDAVAARYDGDVRFARDGLRVEC
jgi:ribonuclease BN (tRNA processing enzyme)